MKNEFQMKVIGRIHSDFSSKFGIPRQSGLVEALKATIVFEKEYRDANAIRGLSDFSHIWLIWQFSKATCKVFSPTVKPPRLGGNKRMGVFATRSPFRPNAIGLSCVKLEAIEYNKELGPVLHVSGADLLDGTPIFDIKPYLPYVDQKADAKGGFAEAFYHYELEVDFPEKWLKLVPTIKQKALIKVLAQDPRPSYQEDASRIYGMEFAGLEVRFTVKDNKLEVCEVGPKEEGTHLVKYKENLPKKEEK